MKLPIKKKYFDLIKSGKKTFELRDAHLTFVCEKTGRKLRRKITGVALASKADFSVYKDVLDKKDKNVVVFDL